MLIPFPKFAIFWRYQQEMLHCNTWGDINLYFHLICISPGDVLAGRTQPRGFFRDDWLLPQGCLTDK